MILVIDNYDSFTYNLVQYLGELGREFPVAQDIRVHRNDCIDVKTIQELAPSGVVISPGPGRPENAGISVSLIRELGSTLPILGVCLGHQGIARAFGGKIISAPILMHGKVSQIHHDNQGIFESLDNPFIATRYHSLAVDRETLPEVLEITARAEDNTIMGLRHRDYPHIQGVQFHPESVLTTSGKKLLRNFLQSLD
ncbi:MULTISPECIES: aminodeoxychorismate/anthranilate synthase component II [Spirulina sp. CCY15215]|uniref:anthranilate synthase component II n=1 Tax=Spirulina sp. CCY15215 TaxID=2767591 RepID=UPI001950A57A|nr:aminodeoxychorismate/anthranilate synthase component II [Spirulina major]